MYEITITVDSPEQTRILTYIIATTSVESAWGMGNRIAMKQGFDAIHTTISAKPLQDNKLMIEL